MQTEHYFGPKGGGLREDSLQKFNQILKILKIVIFFIHVLHAAVLETE
jgi:hypothetical protein